MKYEGFAGQYQHYFCYLKCKVSTHQISDEERAIVCERHCDLFSRKTTLECYELFNAGENVH